MASTSSISIECLINNLEYSFEYLHTSDDVDQLDHIFHRNIYSYPLDEINNFDYLKWNLIQTDGLSDTFYIKSHAFEENYICASFKFDDIFRTKRMIYRKDLRKSKSDNCKWKLLKLDSYSNNRTFRIINLKYKEYMFADETHFKRDLFKRNIYLNARLPSNETNHQYDWLVDCSRGTFFIN